MVKRIVSIILCIAIVVCFTACTEDDPRGVRSSGSGNQYYVIKLPDGKKVTDYFTLTGPEGTVVGMSTDMSSYSENLGTIYNRQATEGGWVAYNKDQSGIIIYMPAGFPENAVAITCAQLAINPNEYMTIEEAKQYIDWLK